MTFMTQQKPLNFHEKAYINIIYLLKTLNKAFKKYDMYIGIRPLVIKGWIMSCDLGETTEGLENEL